jgi:hypothetical protein
MSEEVAAGVLYNWRLKNTETNQIFRTQIFRIRQKVASRNITITTRSRYGYILDAENLARARALIGDRN